MKNFDACLKPLLEHEGGNDDDPQDPGGRTSRGIIQREWDEYVKRHPGLPSDVWNAPDSSVADIYRKQYWDVLRCDDLPAGVDYAVFDYGVNSGVSRAAKTLQGVIGAAVDGEIGPDTLGRAKAALASSIVQNISNERLTFLQGLRTWPRFGRGWTTRINEVQALALKMAGSAKSTPAVVQKPTTGWLSALVSAILAAFRGAPTKPPTVPAPSGTPWMTWAAKEIGFHETGQNRNIGRYTGPAKCGSEGDPWCAIFVNAGLEISGVRGTRSAMARSFEHDANFLRLDGPAFGAITTMWRGSPGSGSGHCFFYAGENERGILALGGNQSDQVCRQYEPKNRIVGYWWPKSVPLPKAGKLNIDGALDGDANEGSET